MVTTYTQYIGLISLTNCLLLNHYNVPVEILIIIEQNFGDPISLKAIVLLLISSDVYFRQKRGMHPAIINFNKGLS